MNDNSTPGEPIEDSNTVSGGETTKSWYQRHKPKIRVALGVAVAVGVGVIGALAAQHPEGHGDEEYEAQDGAGNWAPVSVGDAPSEPRQSVLDPDRDPFLRKLPPGQQASEAAKDRYWDATGNAVPPGYTSVRPWSYQTPEDEDPGKAVA